MSQQKYDILPMAFKYDLTPQQFLFRPSSSSASNSNNIPFTKPPPYVPMATTSETSKTSAAAGPLHRVPSAPRLSTDSDADSIASVNARLICPTSHHIAQRDYTCTIYPTAVLRLFAAILLIICIPLFASHAADRAIPALIFVSLALIRILFIFIFHAPRDARWRGARGVNLAVDFALVAGINGSVGSALVVQGNVAACVLAWIAVCCIAMSAVDTGRPTRIAYTSTLSLDFWTGEGALSLDNWESERPEMGRSASGLV